MHAIRVASKQGHPFGEVRHKISARATRAQKVNFDLTEASIFTFYLYFLRLHTRLKARVHQA